MRPEADLREAVELRERYGSVWAAHRATGIRRATLQERVEEARERFPGWFEKNDDYEAPEVASSDEDLDSVIARLAAEQERKKRARTSTDWMPFRVNGSEPFALIFVGDPHADQCDIGLLRKHVEIIERTPRMWAVGLGDWTNSWVGKLRGQYAFQSITERDSYRLARWLLQKPIWWAVLLGNHNGGRWHGDGSPLKWMENASATPIQEWQVKFSVSCGDASWKVWAAHNFPGNSEHNRNHGLDKRARLTGGIADLFVAGDRHTFKLSQDQHEHTGRVYWSARARGYKPLDLYAEELGFGEQTMGHSIGAVFDPASGRLTCFADVQETADYLTFLRMRRIAA